MLVAIVTVILTFLLTGIIGNFLVQRWQHRNWLNQQRFLGEEREYLALKSLWEELAGLSGKRLSRMRRLLVILDRPDDQFIRKRLSDYDDILGKWNDSLTSFYVRLTLYATHTLQHRLEHEIQIAFLRVGSSLERLVKGRLESGSVSSKAVEQVRSEMDEISGQLFAFDRDILNVVRAQKLTLPPSFIQLRLESGGC